MMTTAVAADGTDAPLWLRNVAISPDASTVAFTYKGDIYTVPVTGGAATRLTTNAAYDTKPVWSPNGKQIAFASDREGSLDIFVMPATGGTPRRVTTFSGNESPRAWLNDSTVLFSTTLLPAQTAAQGGFQSQVYQVNTIATADGKLRRPSLYMSIPAVDMTVDPATGRVLYQDKKGYEDVLRKHETSSSTGDIWLKDGNTFRCLTTFAGQDENPVWSADGKSFYYTSEKTDGTLNVHRRALDGDTDTDLTHFTTHPVRSLSVANNGTLAYSWNGEIYTQQPGSTEPTKLNVEIVTDDYTRSLVKSIRRSGAESISVSPDGEEVAFVVHGDVYVTSVKYNTTRQITNTPEQERVVDFAPDGRSLVYDGERDGQWQLFIASLTDKDEKNFTYAKEIKEESLYKAENGATAFQPAFSPDGKSVAFLEDRTALRVIDVKSRKVTTALDGKFNYSYTDGDVTFEWAPDSRWLLASYIGVGGWNNTDIALVKADGSEVHDLTESGYTDGNAHWVLGGKAMIWESDRQGYRSHGSWGSEADVYIMFFDGEAFDRFRMNEEERAVADANSKEKKKDKDDEDDDKDKDKDKKKDKKVKPLEFDLENAKYRIRRLTTSSSRLGDYALSPKGDKLYYMSDGNLWVIDTEEMDSRILVKDIGGSIELDEKGENLFVLSGSSITKIGIPGGDRSSVDFEATAEYRPFAEREYIYNHMLKQVKDKFYDVNLHGVDWEMYGEAYRRFLPHITNNYDFAELLSEILGELNASHTGSTYSGVHWAQATGVLGAFFSDTYTGDGLQVTEVIKRGPLADKKASVKPGDVIMAIEGKEIKAGEDFFPLLEGRVGKNTRLTVKRAGGKTEDITVKPISAGTQRDLLYRRWVERNQAIVDSVSGGKVAYVHVQGMDSQSYRTVFSELLGKYRNHEAVVVDTRYNGGGWLHNDIAQLLSGREYVRFCPRGQYIGSEPFTQWTKPSVMLVNESNYSDAHGTPYTYQTLKIGDVVGAPVPGTMTAVWWESQIDESIIFGIPQVTSKDMNGNALENHQLTPDVVIYNAPDEVLRGYDAQLIGATKRLLEKLQTK
jgi:Tol biopolymer transport system component/C-terminal processing protease CtpA/Prc